MSTGPKPATPPAFEPPPDFLDPRADPGFEPRHWPLCDGGEAPDFDPAGDVHDRRRVEFLASYYRLNVLQSALIGARGRGDDDQVRQCLADLEEAFRDHDALEDRYTPVGFYGEPRMDGVFYRDIEFNRPELPRLRSTASKASVTVKVPGLEFLPDSELEGETYIGKWPWEEDG